MNIFTASAFIIFFYTMGVINSSDNNVNEKINIETHKDNKKTVDISVDISKKNNATNLIREIKNSKCDFNIHFSIPKQSNSKLFKSGFICSKPSQKKLKNFTDMIVKELNKNPINKYNLYLPLYKQGTLTTILGGNQGKDNIKEMIDIFSKENNITFNLSMNKFGYFYSKHLGYLFKDKFINTLTTPKKELTSIELGGLLGLAIAPNLSSKIEIDTINLSKKHIKIKFKIFKSLLDDLLVLGKNISKDNKRVAEKIDFSYITFTDSSYSNIDENKKTLSIQKSIWKHEFGIDLIF